AAVNARVKFVVITGPVLDPRDPVILDVAVPLAVFKVIAFEDPENTGRVESMGFMQWQTKLVGEVKGSLESLDEVSRAQQWRVAVREISRVTSLDFGPLVAADDVSAGDAHPERLSDVLIARLFPRRMRVARASRY